MGFMATSGLTTRQLATLPTCRSCLGIAAIEHPHRLRVSQPGGQVFLQPPYDCLIGPPGLGEKALHRPGRDAHRFREILGVAPLLVLHQQRLKVIPAVIPPLLAAEGGRKEGVEFLKARCRRPARSSPHSLGAPNIVCPAILPDNSSLYPRNSDGAPRFSPSLSLSDVVDVTGVLANRITDTIMPHKTIILA